MVTLSTPQSKATSLPLLKMCIRDSDQTVPVLSLGGSGCISTIANIIPARFSAMIRSFLAGDTAAAAREQVALKPLIDALFLEVLSLIHI